MAVMPPAASPESCTPCERDTRRLVAYRRGYGLSERASLSARDLGRLGFIRWLVQTGRLGAADGPPPAAG